MPVRVHDLVKKRALITRESAKVIGEALDRALAENEAEVALDLAGIDAVTPSFVDEALSLLEQALRPRLGKSFRVVFLNPPTRLSSKFAAIGRARGLEFLEATDGSWIISSAADTG